MSEPYEPEFVGFPKLYRLKRTCIITEKLDGTNACVIVGPEGQVHAQSRSRLITPEADNYGFATWVRANEEELRKLGRGHHYGEWYGAGIQRKYGLNHKRLALFNTSRPADTLPACCEQVPILYAGDFSTNAVDDALTGLTMFGSRAVPGFMDPEGVVVYLPQARAGYKVTLGGDGHKG